MVAFTCDKMIVADLGIFRRSPFLSLKSADPQFPLFHVFRKGENLLLAYPWRLLQPIAQHDITILPYKMADSILSEIFFALLRLYTVLNKLVP